MKFDLHVHSNVSDGTLSPLELVERANRLDIDVLSITDHDSVAAYEIIKNEALNNIQLVPGIEFSTRWKKNNIHVLGLNINLKNYNLLEIIDNNQKTRIERAEKIIAKLSRKLKIEIPFDEIKQNAHNNNIGRPHVAEYLVKHGIVKDIKQAFALYLGTGKLGDVKSDWVKIEIIIESIISSGGVAVVAHPGKYKFTRTKLMEMLDDFKSMGGQAIEVISGKQTTQLTRDLAKITEFKDLHASCGSDFHTPGQSWTELGHFDAIPNSCKPVWELF